MSIELEATDYCPVGSQHHYAGDRFKVDAETADILVGLKRAKRVKADDKAEKQEYKTRDMKAKG